MLAPLVTTEEGTAPIAGDRELLAPRRPRFEFAQLPDLLDAYFERLNLAVVYGGDKNDPNCVLYRTHNPRAWRSYEAVAEDIAASLRSIGFRNVALLTEGMNLGEQLRRHNIHMAWLNSGGVQGYNPVSHLPAMLEMFGVPYVGHNPLTASVLDNKHAFKRELISAGIPTSPYITWDSARGPLMPEINSRFWDAFGDYEGPFVAKPVSGRASLNVTVVDSMDELPSVVAEIYQATNNLVLIEKYLPGREFVVAVCGQAVSVGQRLSKRRDPFAFSILERVLEPGERIFTSMDV